MLKLTYATLEQVNSISSEGQTDDNGPVWNRFFASFGQAAVDDDASSAVSGSGHPTSDMPRTPDMRSRHLPLETPGSELAPNDSASVVHEEPDSTLASRNGLPTKDAVIPPLEIDDGTYLFKFVAPGNTAHRFQARYDSYEFIREIIEGKLTSDPFFTEPSATAEVAPDPTDFQLAYLDDDNDLVMMTHDRDITDAVTLARKQGKDRVVLHLRGGKGWGEEAGRKLADPHKAATQNLQSIAEDEEREVEEKSTKKKGKKTDEAVAGIPKDLVLPAAIGFLGVVILGVFVATRSSAK